MLAGVIADDPNAEVAVAGNNVAEICVGGADDAIGGLVQLNAIFHVPKAEGVVGIGADPVAEHSGSGRFGAENPNAVLTAAHDGIALENGAAADGDIRCAIDDDAVS